MSSQKLNYLYFKWLCDFVCTDEYPRKESHKKLLHHLHRSDFTYLHPMDANRAEDGISLRYRFGREKSYDDATIAGCLDNRDCSILEMMVALAVICENRIMADPQHGDRTGKWFWGMIDNLGLGRMSNSNYDPDFVDCVVECFLERKYSRDGEGGLFTVTSNQRDQRRVDIWYQMLGYLRNYKE